MINGIMNRYSTFYIKEWYEKNFDSEIQSKNLNDNNLSNKNDTIDLKKEINQTTVKSSRLHLKRNKLSHKITQIDRLITHLYTQKRNLQIKAAKETIKTQHDSISASDIGNNIDTNG